MEIPNTLMYGGKPIYVIVEGRRPLYCACGAAGHLSMACPGGKNPEPQPQPQNNKKSDET